MKNLTVINLKKTMQVVAKKKTALFFNVNRELKDHGHDFRNHTKYNLVFNIDISNCEPKFECQLSCYKRDTELSVM